MLDLAGFKGFYVELLYEFGLERFYDPDAQKETYWRSRKESKDLDVNRTFTFQEEDFATGESGYARCVEQMTAYMASVVKNVDTSKDYFNAESAWESGRLKYQHMGVKTRDGFIHLDYYVNRQGCGCSREDPNCCIEVSLAYSIKINGRTPSADFLKQLFEKNGGSMDEFAYVDYFKEDVNPLDDIVME